MSDYFRQFRGNLSYLGVAKRTAKFGENYYVFRGNLGEELLVKRQNYVFPQVLFKLGENSTLGEKYAFREHIYPLTILVKRSPGFQICG